MGNLFQNEMVSSRRIICTPSQFARSSLLYLQECGTLSAIKPHVSSRANLNSYLFFIVTDGAGQLEYDGAHYELAEGDAVFIDCRKPYSQSSSEKLWTLKWCHFYGPNANAIYRKFKERGGYSVFHPEDFEAYKSLLDEIYTVAGSDAYTRDMRIFQRLASLTAMIMEESWHPEAKQEGALRKIDMQTIKDYVDSDFTEHMTLESLANHFYLSKHHLARCFKEQFGITVNSYIRQVRITKAKELLRFSSCSIETVGIESGFTDSNYFSRVFKKVEGCSPSDYRKNWQSETKDGEKNEG